jgi:hypothetical protein
MIEPAELTINDLVKVDQTTETVTARVLGVHKDGVINYEVDYSGIRATNIIHADYVSPIKLTDDILVKNGFRIQVVHDNGNWLWITDNSWLAYSERHDYWYCEDVKITYVHQLQHLLRLCGIEKSIIL